MVANRVSQGAADSSAARPATRAVSARVAPSAAQRRAQQRLAWWSAGCFLALVGLGGAERSFAAQAQDAAAPSAHSAGATAQQRPATSPEGMGAARTAAPATAARILPGGKEEALEAAFARAAPTWRLDDARIGRDRVEASVRSATGVAVDVLLTDVRGCRAEVAGPWCVQFPGGRPAEAEALLTALSRDGADAFWQTLAPEPTRPPVDVPRSLDEADQAERRRRAATGLWVTLVPLVLGGGLGALWRRRRAVPPSRWQRAAAVGVGVGLVVGIEVGAAPIALWDALWMVAAAAAGLLIGARTWRRAEAVSLALGTVVGLVALEVGARLTLPEPTPEPPLTRGPFFRPSDMPNPIGRTFHWANFACEQLAAARAVDDAGAAVQRGDRRPVALHLGDSMIHGMDVPAAQTAIGLLNSSDAAFRHVNAGMPSTSADAALALYRAWAPTLRPKLVVLHAYAGNDLLEIDANYPCCGGPLLDLDKEEAAPRCNPAAAPAASMAQVLWSESPPPFALRSWAWASAAAAHAANALRSLIHGQSAAFLAPEAQRAERYTRAFHALVREVRASGSELRVILAPHRPDLGRPEQSTAKTRAWLQDLAIAAKVGVASGHDAFAAIDDPQAVTESFGSAHPLDIHLSVAGHARFARWLAETLAQR